MEMTRALSLAIDEMSGVAEARRAASWFGHQLGFNETEIGVLSIIVTELSTNIVKHAATGTIILQSTADFEAGGMEVYALDSGPGIRNPREALKDGFSTKGSSGTGLGAVRRLSHVFEMYSRAEMGTVVRTVLWAGGAKQSSLRHVSVGALCVPLQTEEACGDNWCVRCEDASVVSVLLVDGLGHGEYAARAADAAVSIFQASRIDDPVYDLEVIHAGLKKTRGAVGAVARCDLKQGAFMFAGVGNISGLVISEDLSRRTVSHNGTLGLAMQRNPALAYEWPPGTLLILHTDGIGNHWDLAKYPGLLDASPTLIAAVIFRDFRRERDDSTVLVARYTDV